MGTAAQELAHLEEHVHDVLEGHKQRRPAAAAQIRHHHPRFRRAKSTGIFSARFTRADARLTVAHEHGFPTWAAIAKEARKGPKAHWNLPLLERITDPELRPVLELVAQGDVAAFKAALRTRPALARRRIPAEPAGPLRDATLLELTIGIAGQNPKGLRHAPEILEAVLSATKVSARRIQRAFLFVCSNRLKAAEKTQVEVVRVLVGHGADPGPAAPRAVFAGAFLVAEELLRLGAPETPEVAAGLGHVAKVKELLPSATDNDKRRALALAAMHGRTKVVRLLLDGGLNPSALNPKPFHAHSTPLHQAVWYGHFDTVRLLVERGASLTRPDRAYNGTPLGWAKFGKKERIAKYLEERATEKR